MNFESNCEKDMFHGNSQSLKINVWFFTSENEISGIIYSLFKDRQNNEVDQTFELLSHPLMTILPHLFFFFIFFFFLNN